MENVITFHVPGTPRTQGNKRAVPLKGRNGNWIKAANGATKTVMMESGKYHASWREDVRAALLAAYPGDPLDGPVHVAIVFYFRRPENHYGTRKGEKYLKERAPKWHASIGDIEKLVRSIHDAMSGIAFHDDKQVASLSTSKEWADKAGATIMIRKLGDKE